MTLYKADTLAVGRGPLNDNSNASVIFSSNNAVSTWNSATTYSQYNVVEWTVSSVVQLFRSKISSNTNNQPDTSPNDWEVLYAGPVKDGDVNVQINGSSSTIAQRTSGNWAAVSGGAPASVALVDGQSSPATAFTFLGSSFTSAKVQYTLSRGSSPGQERSGTLNIINDNVVTNVAYDHEFTDLPNNSGVDVSAMLAVAPSGSNVAVTYTSASLGSSLTLKYKISGWS